LEEVRDVFGFLSDIGTLVFTEFIDVLELLEGLDDVEVVSEIKNDVLRAAVKAVIQNSQ
jgi:hypothetical protein